MCWVYGVFDFEKEIEIIKLFKTAKNENIYVTQHAVLLHSKKENRVKVAIVGAMGNIYTLVRVGKNEEHTPEMLLNCYIKHGEGCVDILKGKDSFFIYDENKERVFVARPMDSEEELFYSFSEGALHISTQKERLLDKQTIYLLEKGERFVCCGEEKHGDS